MENKKMDCWDFVFSFVKNHIDLWYNKLTSTPKR